MSKLVGYIIDVDNNKFEIKSNDMAVIKYKPYPDPFIACEWLKTKGRVISIDGAYLRLDVSEEYRSEIIDIPIDGILEFDFTQ